jgi:hypothetical protein
MNTEQLIVQLAGRAAAVTPLAPPAVRLLRWSLAALAGAALGLVVFHVRPGLDGIIGRPEFIVTAVLATATAATAAFAALVLAVPGAERSPALRATAFALLTVWGGICVAAVIRSGHGLSDRIEWPICFVRVVAIGIPPAWMLFAMLRQAAPLRRVSASALAALAATAVGSGAMQFICPLDAPGHALLGHYGPSLVLTGVSAWAAAALLPPRRRGCS